MVFSLILEKRLARKQLLLLIPVGNLQKPTHASAEDMALERSMLGSIIRNVYRSNAPSFPGHIQNKVLPLKNLRWQSHCREL